MSVTMGKQYNLTEKRQCFCREYIVDLDGTKAAIRAGYSPKTARSKAAHLLAKDNVKKYLSELKNQRARRTEVSADMTVQELAVIAFADMRDYVEINQDGSVKVKTLQEMPEGASRAVSKIKERRQSTGKGKIVLDTTIEYHLWDKVRALELLGKHLDMFIDKHEFVGDLGAYTDEEVAQIAAGKVPVRNRIEVSFVGAKEKLMEKVTSLSERQDLENPLIPDTSKVQDLKQ